MMHPSAYCSPTYIEQLQPDSQHHAHPQLSWNGLLSLPGPDNIIRQVNPAGRARTWYLQKYQTQLQKAQQWILFRSSRAPKKSGSRALPLYESSSSTLEFSAQTQATSQIQDTLPLSTEVAGPSWKEKNTSQSEEGSKEEPKWARDSEGTLKPGTWGLQLCLFPLVWQLSTPWGQSSSPQSQQVLYSYLLGCFWAFPHSPCLFSSCS